MRILQSGRLRQHHQFGVEIFVQQVLLRKLRLYLSTEFMKELGLKGVNLYINSIGCKNCRKIYNEVLLDLLKKHEHELCGTCKERMQKNPLRTLDCKVPSCHEIMKNAPRTIDYLDEECKEHFEELKSLLNEMNIAYKEDSGIVRGLDYYTKTVFEFINSEGLTLCGGGRYDNLINEIDGKLDIPAVGFGFGIERIIKELDAEGIELAAEPSVDLYVGILGKESKAAAYRLVKSLRQAGLIVETDYMDRSIKAQMKYANKIGARYTVIIGADELAAGKANIKNMDTGNQVEVDIDKINDFITICE